MNIEFNETIYLNKEEYKVFQKIGRYLSAIETNSHNPDTKDLARKAFSEVSKVWARCTFDNEGLVRDEEEISNKPSAEYTLGYNQGFKDGQEYAENNPSIRPNY